MLRRLCFFCLLLLTAQAKAVIVRGKVTTSLGAPLAAARVQLIRLDEGARSVADAISGIDGAYEIRTGLSGRFLLLTAPSVLQSSLAPQFGAPFYAGHAEVVTVNIALNTSAITPQASHLQSLMDIPLRQLADPPAQVSADQLLNQAIVIPELRPGPGVFVVEYGQVGAPANLYLRGAPVTQTIIDGVSAEDLGGLFNLSTLTTSGLTANAATPAIELSPDANPLHLLDGQAGTLSLTTPTASTVHPVLTYVGTLGNLSTVRNEAIFSLAHTRSDVRLSFSRLNTDNDLPAARLHLITSSANLGYHISAATSLRATLRDDVDATPLALPFAFYNLQPSGKDTAQNLYSSLTFETATASGWRNLARYGLVRKRAQAEDLSTAVTGLPVTITGANGYVASGIATFLPAPAREDFVTNRDEFTYQTDYSVKSWLTVLAIARYQDERGADLTSTLRQTVERQHLSFAGELRGEVKHRFFYHASGFLDDAAPLGVRGAPSLGLTYVPVRQGQRRFRGTSLHVTAASGLREFTLAEQIALPGSLPGSVAEPRSRTFDASIDQDLIAHKLSLRAGYFHNQFAHQTETLGILPLRLSDSLAYRAQGLELSGHYQPFSRLQILGGYTYLAALVEQSAAAPALNPLFPATPVGVFTALAGARPFHRPPNTGFATAQYTGKAFAASVKATFAGKSDDSTNLYLNQNLLLPNRNLSPGYVSVDANLSYAVASRVTIFGEFDNLLDQREIAPIGYLSTPFGVRAGIRLRLGKE